MPQFLPLDDRDVARFVAAIRGGDGDALGELLACRRELATAAFGDEREARTCLHVATDWPGHFPEVASIISLLVAAGAEVDAPFVGAHEERPLHWAASSGDLEAIDALVAAGADLEASGGVHTGGPPLDDAVIFGMLDAARRLVAAGARVQPFHAEALGTADHRES